MSVTESGNSTVSSAWDRYAVAYQNSSRLPTDVVSYGPGVGTEAEYRLLGSVSGKRVLDLGCGGGQACIAMAKQGAIAIGVDISASQLAYARRLIDEEEVKVELRQGDLADLAVQRADTVDVVFSALALQFVPDLNRVFRQVHRVMKNQGTFVFSLPHPISALTDYSASSHAQLSIDVAPAKINRDYFDKAPIDYTVDDNTFTEYPHTFSEVFMGLTRSGFRVDTVLEPENTGNALVPRALIVRARKES